MAKHEHDNRPDVEANGLRADGKKNENKSTKKMNRIWLWLGVLILCFILLWWIFGIGTAEDLSGVVNG